MTFVDSVPMSGYQLLANKLTGHLGGIPVKPIYRRFESLNHRMLLYLQDELVDLEEELKSLDAADTQSRIYPGGSIAPASRRQESQLPNDLYRRKMDVLGRIGYKLVQYSKPRRVYYSAPWLWFTDKTL